MSWLDLSVSLSLRIVGDEGDERWQALTAWGPPQMSSHAPCCEGGHHTPEAAANHGAELTAVTLGRLARALPPGTYGGSVLARVA